VLSSHIALVTKAFLQVSTLLGIAGAEGYVPPAPVRRRGIGLKRDPGAHDHIPGDICPAHRAEVSAIICIGVNVIEVDPVECIEHVQPQLEGDTLGDRSRLPDGEVGLREARILELIDSFVALLS